MVMIQAVTKNSDPQIVQRAGTIVKNYSYLNSFILIFRK
jgi:hypothetical protein